MKTFLILFVAGMFVLLFFLEKAPLPVGSHWETQRGTVVDFATREPIKGAKVEGVSGVPLQIFADRSDCRTNEKGVFALPVRRNRDTAITIHAKGYAPLEWSGELPEPVELLRATAAEKDLVVARIEFPKETHLDGFRVDLERGALTDGSDYDVEFRIDSADTAWAIAQAGPGRSLLVEQRGDSYCPYNFPMVVATVPETGHIPVARVPRHMSSLLCVVRRDNGPRYAVASFHPQFWFPGEGGFRYTAFETVFNRAGGRGFLGASRPVFQ